MAKNSGKIAIVTGASRGIGAAVAERLADDGFTVVINYSGDAAPAEALARKIESKGGRALTAKADVSDAQAVRGMFDAAETAFGGVDVLVNNAGIMTLSTIVETNDAAFDRQVNVNLKGTFNTLREAASRIRAGGRIINFSSSVVGLLQPTYGVYAATKAAVEAMTSILAKELRSRNITVNAIAPGPTATDLFLKENRKRSSTTSQSSHRSSVSASQRISPARSPSLRVPTAPGSTARRCAPTAESSERRLRNPA